MKLIYIGFVFFIAFINVAVAQEIIFSKTEKANNLNSPTDIEVIGKISNNFVVYKKYDVMSRITVYDENMQVLNVRKLKFIATNAFSVDFINYPDFFYIIWQYKKDSSIYCKAAKINADGDLIGEVFLVNKILPNAYSYYNKFSIKTSEDKSKIMFFNIKQDSSNLNISTKIYNDNFSLIDSSAITVLDFNNKLESIDNFLIDNEGSFLFNRNTKRDVRQKMLETLEVYFKKIATQNLIKVEVAIDSIFIKRPFIKIDNLNKQYIINSFNYNKNSLQIEGIASFLINKRPYVLSKSKIILFPDSIKKKFTAANNNGYEYYFQDILLTKNGGFSAVVHKYTQTKSPTIKEMRTNLHPYLKSQGFPYNNSYSFLATDNTKIASNLINLDDFYIPNSYPVSNKLLYNQNNTIPKPISQIDTKETLVDAGNFVAILDINNNLDFKNFGSIVSTYKHHASNFYTFVIADKLHCFFLEVNRNNQILLNNYSFLETSEFYKDAIIKSRKLSFVYRLNLAKQTGLKQLIIPCIFRNSVAFAKIDF